MSESTLSNMLSELAAISPMPRDRVLLDEEDGADLVDRYDALVEGVSQHVAREKPGPDEEAELVRVLADSFGLGGGMGVYWGTLHLIERCTPSVAYPIIQDRVIHGPPGSRYWCCFILGRRRNLDDLPLFLTPLSDDVPDLQEQALQSLEMLSQEHTLKDVLPAILPLTQHADPRVRKAAQDALRTLST